MLEFPHIDPAQRLPDAIVAYQQKQPRTWTDWLTAVHALRNRLASQPGGTWAVYFADSYDFSVALFALWSSQRKPLMLPDTAAHTLAGIKQSVSGYLGEPCAATTAAFATTITLPATAGSPAPVIEPLSVNSTIALLTSGSTGDPVQIDKQPGQLMPEVLTYAEAWHQELASTTFVATVSHQHIYGLIFKVLLPLALQQPFVAEMYSNPRSLLLQASVDQPVTWIASPAQLKRLRVEMPGTAHIRAIFSSGGLLETTAAHTVEQLFGFPAREIYGSTETGGIAFRQQFSQHKASNWQLLPGVTSRINADDLLQVRSAFTENQWLTTNDRVNFADDHSFNLLGRADRIVKLEEKRVSLSATERQLQKLPEVAEARVLVLPGQREQLATVVVLTDEGWRKLFSQGRNPLIQYLRAELSAQLESHGVPRRYRFVHEFPVNTQSKVRLADLQALFAFGAGQVLPLIRDVTVESVDVEEPAVSLHLEVPEDLEYFAGHFADFPLVPGVVQLLWVNHYATLHLGFSGASQKLSQIKFKAMLRPAQRVTLKLQFQLQSGRLKFLLSHAQQEFSSGTLWDQRIVQADD